MERTKYITVKGTPNSRTRVVFKNNAGNSYNQSTQAFESGTNFIDISIGPEGRSVVPIFLPDITSDDVYTLSIKPTAGTFTDTKLLAKENYISERDYVEKTITWTTSHNVAGYTIASGLSSTFKGVPDTTEYSRDFLEGGRYFSLSGNITKSGALLYVVRQPVGDFVSLDGRDGDFTNTAKPIYTVLATKPSEATLRISGNTNISNGDYVWGEGINEKITITKSGNIITLSGQTEFPHFEIDQELHFSEGGHYVNISSAELTGSGTNTIAGSVKGHISKMGYDDDTMTWLLNDTVTTVPNIFGDNGAINVNRTATCTAGATVEINCGSGDTDANAGSKTYSRVSGPSRGSVGNNSTAFNNNTFTGSSITYNNTSGSAGDTDSFVIKCNDGTTDSANQTVTITLT